MKQDHTHIAVILDRSGSMESMKKMEFEEEYRKKTDDDAGQNACYFHPSHKLTSVQQ